MDHVICCFFNLSREKKMAQARLTEFFSQRKRGADIQPSKRRKIQRVQDVILVPESKPSPPVACRTRARTDAKVLAPTNLKISSKGKAKATSTKSKGRRCKSIAVKHVDESQPNIKEAFKQREAKGDSTNSESTNAIDTNSVEDLASEITAVCDDHCVSPPSTPTKRDSKIDDSEVSRKRSKHAKSVRKDLFNVATRTPPTQEEKGFDFDQFFSQNPKQLAVRKKLILQKSNTNISSGDGKLLSLSNISSVKLDFSKGNDQTEVSASTSKPDNQHEGNVEISKETKESLDESTSSTEKVSTDVHKSEEIVLSTPTKPCKSTTVLPVSPLQERSPKVHYGTKEKTKLDLISLRSKLSKCGKLEELKQKLAEFSKASSTPKKSQKSVTRLSESSTSTVTSDSQSNKKVPAYERLHALAVDVPPSLSLPYKYKILKEMFESMETVVSMLAKRQEICTFSKLKTAVQGIVRKSFELKHVGQIKTVYPSAYTFCQEKNLPCFGGKISGHQLTIEANIDEENVKTGNSGKKTDKINIKPSFTVVKFTERKAIFHRNLIQIVKKYHKEFLASLERPLTIPDDKITRWHPKFALDELPDIQPASLPVAPDVKKISTAQEALDQARGKLDPRVRKALEMVAAQNKKKEELKKNNNSPRTPTKKGCNSPSTPKKLPNSPKINSPGSKLNSSGSAVKGVSLSLLERIRAKESMKLESAMTRNPEQDLRLTMLGRLPELIRILRTFYITQKKPALPLEDTVQKLSDSYRSPLSQVEAEKHLKLLAEVQPDWVSIIQVRKGRFVKIDKNQDITRVISHVENMLKAAT